MDGVACPQCGDLVGIELTRFGERRIDLQAERMFRRHRHQPETRRQRLLSVAQVAAGRFRLYLISRRVHERAATTVPVDREARRRRNRAASRSRARNRR